ncbi:acetyl-CoA carboxylase biotin carboxyl carrier protein [Algoriphagus iocasae]|jgi:acetyl-CoA carboxylase biotin carboxyl carrier protein|uniref:Biotin carboxyl carrier protein of acetyl-CoA carboxylase n=1 Tax=Algoriphagus iocasae TaxID=1836499 RepID=A0A841MLB7_9BACT|nr:acetyl-CoA carboxylase biotin carboxyl carrier protein [Algoriphagus iocasae]MBB6325604.1 acetyl-CoA carboxylase biotin carboxyl carrier protein [Algoriphagus iocasae]
MKPKEIQELIDYISNSGLAEVKIKTDEFELSIKKDSSNVRVVEAAPAPAPVAAPAPAQAAPAPAPAAPAAAPAAQEASNLVEIKSPMIGTFYLTPNPDSPAFVNVGDSVKPGQTVCIIEAMKLFNEIESEVSGKIVKILVTNSTPVEYDQPLFLVDPAG